MSEVARLCARLIAAGAIPRRELPELDHSVVRDEVESSLRSCGLCLTSSAYSDHYGVQLAVETADASVLDSATNLGLGTDACALLTVLWARLALQHRTATDTRTTPADQQALLPSERAHEASSYTPSVHFATIEREFGKHLGGRTRLKALLGRLRRLGFVKYHKLDDIRPGPLLELGIDGERMVAFIRSRVLAQMLGIQQDSQPAGTADSQQEPASTLERVALPIAPRKPSRAVGDR